MNRHFPPHRSGSPHRCSGPRHRSGSPPLPRPLLRFYRLLPVIALILALHGMAACRPTRLEIDPAEVKTLQVRRADSLTRFCPGEVFQVEMLAMLKDGTECSSVRSDTGCRKQKHSVLSPSSVALFAQPGEWVAIEKYLFRPHPDPWKTMRNGITLRGWVQGTAKSRQERSQEVRQRLFPEYTCHSATPRVYEPAHAPTGRPGGRGPTLTVMATPFSTPYYHDAVLIKVLVDGVAHYYISQDPDHPVTIISRGQRGGSGYDGRDGISGLDGSNASSDCQAGGDGGDGGHGENGGPGYPGGPGGEIHLLIDQNAVRKLENRVFVRSDGGLGGPGGLGGRGGRGGSGGYGKGGTNCTATNGRQGSQGHSGHDGAPGPEGPPGSVQMSVAPAAEMFSMELPRMKKMAPKGI